MIYGYCVRYADGSCTPDVEVYILIKTMVSYFVETLAISTVLTQRNWILCYAGGKWYWIVP